MNLSFVFLKFPTEIQVKILDYFNVEDKFELRKVSESLEEIVNLSFGKVNLWGKR